MLREEHCIPECAMVVVSDRRMNKVVTKGGLVHGYPFVRMNTKQDDPPCLNFREPILFLSTRYQLPGLSSHDGSHNDNSSSRWSRLTGYFESPRSGYVNNSVDYMFRE